MEIKDVETQLGIQFPKLFCEVNQSGTNFFSESMGDCLPLAIDTIQGDCNELYECLNSDLAIYGHKAINPVYRLIPFARKISGDRYCFLYEDGKTEPKIVLYGHDTGDVDWQANNFEQFIYFQIVVEVADGEHEINSDYIKAHIKYLNDEHRQTLAEVPIQEIFEQLPEVQECNIWI